MPATITRVRMPHDNRLSVSASLKTSEVWQKTVGYDPYAPESSGDKTNNSSNCSSYGRFGQNSIYTDDNYEINDKAKGLFALARLTGNSSNTTPGACRKCGEFGHLSYQCRNVSDFAKKSLIEMKTYTKINSDTDDSEKEERERKLLGIDSDSTDDGNRNDALDRKKKKKNKSKEKLKNDKIKKTKKRKKKHFR